MFHISRSRCSPKIHLHICSCKHNICEDGFPALLIREKKPAFLTAPVRTVKKTSCKLVVPLLFICGSRTQTSSGHEPYPL